MSHLFTVTAEEDLWESKASSHINGITEDAFTVHKNSVPN